MDKIEALLQIMWEQLITLSERSRTLLGWLSMNNSWHTLKWAVFADISSIMNTWKMLADLVNKDDSSWTTKT